MDKQINAGGPWTRHGHSIPGITVAGSGRPPIARCGGPTMCRQCEDDVERIQTEHATAAELAAMSTELGSVQEVRTEDHVCGYKGETAKSLWEQRNRLQSQTSAEVRTETVPDEEVRRHPLHQVLTDALRTLAPDVPAVRIWGRRTTTGIAAMQGYQGNSWAGDPEDVADHLVRAVLDNLPTIDGKWAITPTLEHLDDDLPRLTTTSPRVLARGQVTINPGPPAEPE